jgi:hypothetical protein
MVFGYFGYFHKLKSSNMSQPPVSSSLFGPNILSTLSLCSSLNVRDPYGTTGKADEKRKSSGLKNFPEFYGT